MPINATIGQSIVFTAVFFDTAEAVTVPSSATITVTYPPSANSLTTVSCSIGMTAAGNFFTATWASSVAALGLSSYSVSAPGQVTPAAGATGTLRLIS
jgi:hypothetical protein